MARLIPKIEPAEIQNTGERKIAEALVAQLPKEVDVFHSFNWVRKSSEGVLQEGECDFVVLDPSAGILFIEVKGGELEFDFNTKEWVRTYPSGKSVTLNKNPFAQVRTSMHELRQRIGKQLTGGDVAFTYGCGAAFPDCRFFGALPADVTAEMLLDAEKCRDIGDAVKKLFAANKRPDHRTPNSRDVESIHQALYPRYSITPVIWRRVEDQEEKLRRLTEEQEHLLEFLANRRLAAISGVAGSGKTILALAKAQSIAKEGARTLFLCYNKPLKDWLVQAVPDSFKNHLVIDTYHGLVWEVCREARIKMPLDSEYKDDNFWHNEAPEKLMEACDILGSKAKFDAVVVDEGQDFRSLWWASLDSVFRNPVDKGCYFVFYDPNQNLYVEKAEIPEELGEPFELPTNCRNTVKIAEHCAALVGKAPKTRLGAPVGDEPVVQKVRNFSEAMNAAGKVVREWCMPRAGGLKYSQVAVLAAGMTQKQWPNAFQTVPATRNFNEWRENGAVLIESWSRFKGLEADAIVILEIPSDDTYALANRYVARSRAKHLLTVIEIGNMDK